MKINILIFLLLVNIHSYSMESNTEPHSCFMCEYHDGQLSRHDVTYDVWETFFKMSYRERLLNYAPLSAFYHTKCPRCSVTLRAVRKKSLESFINTHSKKCFDKKSKELIAWDINKPTTGYRCKIECPFVKTENCSYLKNTIFQLITLVEKEPCYLKQHLKITHNIDITDEILKKSITYTEEKE